VRAGFKHTFILFILAVQLSGQSQFAWQWVQSSGYASRVVARDMVTDPQGNVIVTGYFIGSSAVFGNDTLKNQYPDLERFMLVKFDRSGNVIWSRTVAQNETGVKGNALATDKSGNIFVAGTFRTYYLRLGNDTLVNKLNNNWFLAKYDPNGNVVWGRGPKTSYDAVPEDLITTDGGEIYIAGEFDYPFMDMGTMKLYAASGSAAFILKYSTDGAILWARSSKGSKYDRGLGVALSAGNVVIAGDFDSPMISFDSLSLENTITGNKSGFMTAYSGAGKAVWTTRISASGEVIIAGLSADDQGAIAVCGNYFGTSLFAGNGVVKSDTTDAQMFVVKFDKSGNFKWGDANAGINLQACSCLPDGGVQFGATFYTKTATIDWLTLNNSGPGSNDALFGCYHRTGLIMGGTTGGGPDSEDLPVAIASDECSPTIQLITISAMAKFGPYQVETLALTGMVLASLSNSEYVSIDELLASGVSIFPNPARSTLHVRSGENITKIELLSMDGKLLVVKKILDAPGIDMSVEKLLPSVYLIAVHTASGVKFSKIAVSAEN
jgi:hypothetical protein